VVHAHWWFPGGLIAAGVQRVTGVPLVTTSHGSDVRLARTVPGGARLLAAVARRTARFTAVSSWLGAELAALVPGLTVEVAPMPVDVARFAPAARPARGRLLFVGRLNEQKGLARLLEALAATRSTIGLDVVADGPREAVLRAQAQALGLDGRVTWLGAQPPTRLAALYADAAALVVPSIGEGLGLVAVEAQLSATPVVAFASGGLTDVVRADETGLLVPAGDVAALTRALDRLAADPALGARLGEAGRAAALARFAPAVVAARYEGLYRAAIAGRAA
jgi:glycosyltransferase involved in cell wall biosynthesis